MEELNIKNYAHIGDAVYEVFIREKTVMITSNLNKLHKYTVHFVNAGFQSQLLDKIMPYLNEKEKDIARRARNIPTSSSRKIDKTLHSAATSLEAVFGYNYIHNKDRYMELCNIINSLVNFNEINPES